LISVSYSLSFSVLSEDSKSQWALNSLHYIFAPFSLSVFDFGGPNSFGKLWTDFEGGLAKKVYSLVSNLNGSFKTMSHLLEIHGLPYYASVFGYFGIFLFFLTIDQITPIPEEVSLLTIGYLSSKGIFNPFIAGMIALIAFLTVDTSYFFIIKTGKKISQRLRKKMESPFFKKMKGKMKTNFPKTLFILCFIPRMRQFVPMASSALEIPYERFIKYDSMSLALFTSVYISLGMIFHKGLNSVIAKLESMQNLVFIITLGVLTIVIFIFVQKYRRANAGSG
jgi:membrane-associated protein